MTVVELKNILAAWPEHHKDGNPCEVWIDLGNGASSELRKVERLGVRGDDYESTYDAYLTKDAA